MTILCSTSLKKWVKPVWRLPHSNSPMKNWRWVWPGKLLRKKMLSIQGSRQLLPLPSDMIRKSRRRSDRKMLKLPSKSTKSKSVPMQEPFSKVTMMSVLIITFSLIRTFKIKGSNFNRSYLPYVNFLSYHADQRSMKTGNTKLVLWFFILRGFIHLGCFKKDWFFISSLF